MEFAIIASAMIVLTFTVVQVGLYFYARSVALGAATQGVNSGRGYNAPESAAQTTAQRFLDQAGAGLTDKRITVTRNGQDIQVTVTGTAISVLPGVSFTVSQTAHGSIEQPS